MARRSHPIPSVALILWVLLTHFCSGVRVELALGATVGESVTFVCTVNVSAAGSVAWQWSKDGVVLTQSDSRIVGVGTVNLTILTVEESDFGKYSCSPNPADNQRQNFMLSGNYIILSCNIRYQYNSTQVELGVVTRHDKCPMFVTSSFKN